MDIKRDGNLCVLLSEITLNSLKNENNIDLQKCYHILMGAYFDILTVTINSDLTNLELKDFTEKFAACIKSHYAEIYETILENKVLQSENL